MEKGDAVQQSPQQLVGIKMPRSRPKPMLALQKGIRLTIDRDQETGGGVERGLGWHVGEIGGWERQGKRDVVS
jgi:hypothetical protein